jgi:hypothetical protein
MRVNEVIAQADRIWHASKPPVSREGVLLAILIALIQEKSDKGQ